jgi:hypothetical protein
MVLAANGEVIWNRVPLIRFGLEQMYSISGI